MRTGVLKIGLQGSALGLAQPGNKHFGNKPAAEITLSVCLCLSNNRAFECISIWSSHTSHAQ